MRVLRRVQGERLRAVFSYSRGDFDHIILAQERYRALVLDINDMPFLFVIVDCANQ